jgi:hypothetical protein
MAIQCIIMAAACINNDISKRNVLYCLRDPALVSTLKSTRLKRMGCVVSLQA